MRMMKLALITGHSRPDRHRLGLGDHGQEADSRRLAFPPRSGQIVGEFCAIEKWHPAVAKCEESKEGDVTFRTLTLKDGGKIKEKLTGTEDLAYTYEIVESPLPVKNYKSKLWLEVDDEPDRSVIYWQSDFDRRRQERRRGQEGHHRHPHRRRERHQAGGHQGLRRGPPGRQAREDDDDKDSK